ncbi:MAG: hypothetical protein U0822_05280 [Anaerolineae bacterium]
MAAQMAMVDRQYNELLLALQDGWAVDPPIYVRPTWWTHSASQLTYHFVLRRRGELNLVSVADSVVVRDLIEQQNWHCSWLLADFDQY